MTQKYAFEEYNTELMSKACGLSLGISTKQGVEICNAVRKKPLPRAKKILADAIEGKKAIPFKRFNSDVGHKTKIGPGRYAIKASTEILNIIKSAESNAQIKGLNTNNMIIRHICCHKASTPWHFGRQRGIKMKRTHVEVVLEEVKGVKEEKKKSTKKKETTTKPETTKEVKQEKVEKVVEEKKEEKQKEQVPQEKVVEQPKPEIKKSQSQESKKEDLQESKEIKSDEPKKEEPKEPKKEEPKELKKEDEKVEK